MIVLTKDLTGVALDWAVARAEGLTVRPDVWHADGVAVGEGDGDLVLFAPSIDPADGYPIIEREGIETAPTYAEDELTKTGWMAVLFSDERCEREPVLATGPTALVAAMRCHVAHKLGPSIDTPEELLR